jgi:hypothetical protein
MQCNGLTGLAMLLGGGVDIFLSTRQTLHAKVAVVRRPHWLVGSSISTP